jgi:hypothetical protein
MRRWLMPAAICLLLLGLFYAEENWRGKRAWEKCKRVLRTQGIALDWTNYIPAAVPENENIFGVPEMVRWFDGRTGVGWSELARTLPSETYPGLNLGSNTARMPVAELVIGLPGTHSPNGFTVLRWGASASRTQAATMLNDALGPTARAPQSPIGLGLMLRQPAEIRPAQIFLQCQSAPSEKELNEFLPDSMVHANPGLSDRVLKLEPDGDGSYSVTMPRLALASDYLSWSDGLQPQLALIRRALERPRSQLPGVYANPNTVPGPNFQAVRSLVQTLGARVQCHLLLGRPADALDELTLMDDFCRRILAEQQPATFLSAMVNQAVREVYAAQIAEGLRLQAWREPQLATLQGQLETVNVLVPVAAAFTTQAASAYRALESVPSAGMVRRTVLARLCPRGWGYQHVAARAKLDFGRLACCDPAREIIFPEKVIAADKKAHALESGAYTFVPSLEQVPFARACQLTAHSQTQINQALIACALEHFRLTHDGEYPEELGALVPQFLGAIPHDVIGGGPFHYRQASDHTFVLYSVGWNRRDDGGVRGQRNSTDGDWVWPD